MQNLPSIKDVPDLAGKRVLVRASLNVPITEGVVTNMFRIKKALPTIEWLREQGARVVVMAHIGRDQTDTLKPVYEALREHVPLEWCPTTTGEAAKAAVAALETGDVLLLENVRQDEREKENDAAFATELATLADVYVNDAFAASHRAHVSIVGVPKLLPSYFGLNFIEECTELNAAMKPETPSLFMLGGAKFDTKLPLVDMYANTYTHVFIGGALANDLFKARGYEVGQSLVSDVDLRDQPIVNHPNILLPSDVTVTDGEVSRITTPDDVQPTEKIVDAGPETIKALTGYITAAKTLLWNGPVGLYEGGFSTYTEALAERVAAADGYSIVGGGDTIAAIEDLQLAAQFDFLSTGGGAMLSYLEHGTLPAITAVVGEA